MNRLTKNIATFHLILGVTVFVIFVITGRYMRVDFPDKEIIPPELRLLMRSRHIYIFFSAMINLTLGIYLQIRPKRWQQNLQYLGSFLLMLSSGVLLWAFIVETYQIQHFSSLSYFGLFASLGGVGLHVIGGFGQNRGRQ